MSKMEDKLSNFDVNVFRILRNFYDSNFENKKNEIGSSDSPFCGRQLIIMKNENMQKETNIIMLIGKIFHKLFQQKEVMYAMYGEIYRQTGIKIKESSIMPKEDGEEKFDLVEIYPGYFWRFHIDSFTNKYPIEFKFSKTYTRDWVREMALHHILQLNSYMGHWKQSIGFLCRVNLRFIFADINSVQGEAYWSKLWHDYGYFLPHYFDKKMYENTLKRVKLLAQGIEEYNIDLFPDCQFEWECNKKYCPEFVRKKCGKEEYICREYKTIEKGANKGKKRLCNKAMYDFPIRLTGRFVTEPMCEDCFLKANPHSKYIKYKYQNYKEIIEKK